MTYINIALKKQVKKRAGNCCEYCLLNEADEGYSFHIEHLQARKHLGTDDIDNLGLSCSECNAFKGTDVGSFDSETGDFYPLYNPRKQKWDDHFRLNEAIIEGITPHGRVTAFLLRFNSPNRIEDRKILIKLGRYPCKPPE